MTASLSAYILPGTLQELLPHRAPMLLIDELVGCDSESVTAQIQISSQSPFYSSENQGVPVWIGTEYMAQAIGVWEGARKHREGKKIQPLFLSSIRNYQNHGEEEFFNNNKKLRVSVTVISFDEESCMAVFDCTINNSAINDRTKKEDYVLLASARINVFCPDDVLI